MAELDRGSGGGGTTTTEALTELFRSYLDPDNPRLLGKVDFGAIIGDSARATVGAVFVAISTIWLAIFDGFRLVVSTAEFAVRETMLTIGLSPTLVLGPAQAATAQAVSGLGLLGLPVATGTTLLSFGIVAFVIVLAWGSR